MTDLWLEVRSEDVGADVQIECLLTAPLLAVS